MTDLLIRQKCKPRVLTISSQYNNEIVLGEMSFVATMFEISFEVNH